MLGNTTSHKELMVELNKDIEFREAYKSLDPYFDLLDEIIFRRKKLSLTQQELANRLGDHQSAISRLESGAHAISLEKFLLIVEALEAKVAIVDLDDGEQAAFSKLVGADRISANRSENVTFSDLETYESFLSFVVSED